MIRSQINRALSKSENRAISGSSNVLDQILPDTEFFTSEDAENWESALGLTNGEGTTLADRKAKINRKLAFPGTIPARGDALYVERELQQAGFNLWVYENRFPDGFGGYETKTFQEVAGLVGQAVHYPATQHGQIQHGSNNEKKIVNSMDAAIDNAFDIDGNYERTFFVGGSLIGEIGIVPAARNAELRQLILTLKPVQTVAYMLVTYI